jgi:hypothetical protein
MGRTVEQYDPHILYHAINLTVELEYKIPMKKIYKILEKVEEQNKKNETKISPQEVLELLQTLGDSLESSVESDVSAGPCDGVDGDGSNSVSLQEKIKELLRLTGCTLSEKELNRILKGEISLDDALSSKAKAAWLIVFDIDEHGKFRPDREVVDQMLWCTQSLALENIEVKLERYQINKEIDAKNRIHTQGMLQKNDNLKTLFRSEKERNDPAVLDEKRRKLKLYIAHMQGYDRDRDRDGGRGIDMTTGEIIDFGDIYIADKEHGSFIHDLEHDGIDIADIH